MPGSLPGKPNTFSNSSAATPTVAPTLRTTVATSSSGATIERSSRASTIVMTSSTLGTITRRSRAPVSRVSRSLAVVPPTRASASTPRDRRPQVLDGVQCLVGVGGLGEGGVEPHQPVHDDRVAAAGRAALAGEGGDRGDAVDPGGGLATAGQSLSGVMITAGLAPPASKCRSRACWPVADSVPPRTAWLSGMPSAENVGAKAAAANSADEGPDQHPARPAADDLRDPLPAAAVPVLVPYCGRNGQNAARPSSTSTAGRKVSAASTASATLTAEIGPRPRLEPRSEKSRQRTPRMTVAPLATIGAHDCAQRDPHRGRTSTRSCAQFLAVPGDQQQAVVGGGADDEDRGDALALAVDRRSSRPWPAGRRRPWRR